MKKNLLVLVALIISSILSAQEHVQKYYPENDQQVLKKLEQWQDMKFGLLMHWGAYSQWGIVESWSICPEDYGWTQRKKEGAPGTYFEYVKAYENLATTFKPTDFDPEKWAKAAKNAGMKYLVFTTKHHDGYCMFDSKYTDYKITGSKSPYKNDPRANITKEVFDAFRTEGIWAGAYFSKPDWHNENYWWPYFPPKDRNVNYDPLKYPERWNNFTEFTHKQIMEILTDYGDVDILWLDGGWVKKQAKEVIDGFYKKRIKGSETGFMNGTIVDQDIKMDELKLKARKAQPGIIVVDRSVEGPNQNYLTPENKVPEKQLPFPWESCIIAGGGWSWVPDAKYKSGYETVKMLVDIVCKGGNLLLNIAPGPDGTWDQGAYDLLDEVGSWMDINSKAIYGTRAIAPYKDDKISYTNKKGTDTIYAIYSGEETESTIPRYIEIKSFVAEKGSKVKLLGSDKELKWKAFGEGMQIEVPSKLRKNPPSKHNWCFEIEKITIHLSK